MTIKNVVVAGGGVLGSQIAYQAAYKGFNVTVWLRSEGSVERAKPKFEQLRQTYLATLEAMKSDSAAYCRGLADTPELSVDKSSSLSSARNRRSRASCSPPAMRMRQRMPTW